MPGGRSTPGATWWWPRAPRPAATPAQVATMPLVPQIVDAVGARCRSWRPVGSSTGGGWPPRWPSGADGVWIGTRFIATPEARGVAGYKDALIRTGEDGTTISRAYSGKTMRVVRNQYTAYYEEHPASCSRSRPSWAGRCEEGAFHLGGGEDTPDIDPERECYPTGQGVGAIQTLDPGGQPGGPDRHPGRAGPGRHRAGWPAPGPEPPGRRSPGPRRQLASRGPSGRRSGARR